MSGGYCRREWHDPKVAAEEAGNLECFSELWKNIPKSSQSSM
jgi:hypothetical protein